LKRRLIVFGIAFLIPVTNIRAVTQVEGLTLLAARNPAFPCAPAIRVLKKTPKPGIQVLWRYFGNSNKCLNRILKRVPKTVIYIHPVYGGHNNKIPKRIGNIVRNIVQFTLKWPHARFILSAGLEDGYSRGVYKRVYRIIENTFYWKRLEIARNPVRPSFIGAAEHLELHDKAPCEAVFREKRSRVASSDGLSLSPMGLYRYAQKARLSCDMFFLWLPSSQGIGQSGQKPRGDPRKRQFKFSSSDVRLVSSILRNGRPKGPP